MFKRGFFLGRVCHVKLRRSLASRELAPPVLRHLNPMLASIRGGKLDGYATCGGVDVADAYATQK